MEAARHGTPPRRALLAINEASRLGRSDIGPALRTLTAAGIDVVDARCTTATDLCACIRANRSEVDCIVIGGGDGTLNAAGLALVETGLPLGLLPLGTANDFARSVGIPTEMEAAARVITDGFTHRVDVGDVNGCVFFNVASVGIAADLANSLTRERKRRFGRFSYAMTAARLMLETTPFHATLIFGRDKVMVRTFQVTIGNGRFYGGGNVIAAGARIDDGQLDLYSLEFSKVWRMALLFPSFPRGGHGAMREVRTARADSFEVITRTPRPVNADGELVTRTPALFTQKRRAVGVYVPETCPLLQGLGPP